VQEFAAVVRETSPPDGFFDLCAAPDVLQRQKRGQVIYFEHVDMARADQSLAK